MQNQSRSTALLVVAGVALAALAAIIAYKIGAGDPPRVTSFDECVAAGFPVMESYPAQCSDGTQTFVQNVVQTESVSESGNVRVTEPASGGTVGLPLVIRGQARAFENNVNWRLRDQDGTTLAEGFATADAPDVGQFGAFSVSSSYSQPRGTRGTRGTVEVFTTSAENGSEQDRVSIPVSFDADAASSVRVFFSSTTSDPNTERCEITYPATRRIGTTSAPARAAIEELLKGPSDSERAAGMLTSIPGGVRLLGITISGGVARVNFSDELRAAAGGSCRVAAVRSQIESTLKQFSTVSSVVILVNGQGDVLEP